MVGVQKLFRVRLETDAAVQIPPLAFVDDDPESESSLGIRVWTRGALQQVLEPVFDDFVQQYRDEGSIVSPGACLEGLVHTLDAALAGADPEALDGLEIAVALSSGRGLYLLHTTNLEARCALGGPPQPLRSTLDVRVKDLSPATMRRSHQWSAELVERLRLVRVFLQDETRATLSLNTRPLDADIFAETGRAVLVVEKEAAPDLEGALSDGDGNSSWPDLDDAPRRDRRTLSFAAIGLVVLLFGTALLGMWRWQRIGSHGASPSGAERLFAESVDSQLEPRQESSRVASEVVTEDAETGDETGEAANLAIVWSKRHKDWVTSSPRLAHGHVVYGCRDGSLYAVESNGEVAWEYDSGAGIGATPAVDGDRVFCGNYAGRVFAIGAKNGKEAWAVELGARIVASPVVGKKWVFVATQAGDLVALQKKNGREVWRHALGGKPRVTPLAVDDHLIVPGADGEMLCLAQKSGEIEWTYNTGAEVTSSPVRVGDRVAFGSKDGGVHMVTLRDGGLAWLQRTKGAVQAAPALGKDLLYVASDRRLVALRPQTGEVAWTFPTRAAILATPSVADGKVYVAAYDRHTYVLDAKSGKELSRLRLKAPIFSSPLVVDGRIYVGSNDGTVYCMTASRD